MKSTSNFSSNLKSKQGDIYQRITMLVDDELPREERIKLIAEIEENPEWKKIYEQEMKFKAYLNKNASHQKAPASLINNIKANIKLPADN